MACCCAPTICPGACAGIDPRPLPNYLQVEISNFTGSLGDYQRSPNGTYIVPALQISCNIFPAGQLSCEAVQNECAFYRIYLDLNSNPRGTSTCCGGGSDIDVLSGSADSRVDSTIEVDRGRYGGGFSFSYADLVSCCDFVIACGAGVPFRYTQAAWLQMLCTRTLDLSGTATGAYRRRLPFGTQSFGSVSLAYRITVNDLP